MNYKKIYRNLIDKRRKCIPIGYVEKHHIVPRSLGGTDDDDNLVLLTAREHFIAHLLLVKIHKNTSAYYKVVKAFYMMLVCESGNQKRYVSSRKYDTLRKHFAIAKSIEQSGSGNSQFGTCWIYHELFGHRKVDGDLIEEYISQGWFKGQKLQYVRARKKKPIMINLNELSDWYEIYINHGFTKFCEITSYNKSQPNLVQLFAKYIPKFVPQNGKKR